MKQRISEGEPFIADYLDSKWISFTKQKEIHGLKNDIKHFRIADFYLRRYMVYIEFCGDWNTSDEHRKNYKIKMAVYGKNKIPCIYIYPENLGILSFLFQRRLVKVLIEHKSRLLLLRYLILNTIEEKGIYAIGIVACSIYLIYSLIQFDSLSEDGFVLLIAAGLFLVLSVFNVYRFNKRLFPKK